MNTLFTVNGASYGDERTYNGLRHLYGCARHEAGGADGGGNAARWRGWSEWAEKMLVFVRDVDLSAGCQHYYGMLFMRPAQVRIHSHDTRRRGRLCE